MNHCRACGATVGFISQTQAVSVADCQCPHCVIARANIDINTVDRFKARCAAEAQVKDTTPKSGLDIRLNPPILTPAEQFRAEAVAVADAVQTRDDLLNRIAILEAEVAQLQRRNGQRQHDYLYLLEMERHDKEKFRNRIAAITATFYHADLTISSVQPILALACELNPELVERAR